MKDREVRQFVEVLDLYRAHYAATLVSATARAKEEAKGQVLASTATDAIVATGGLPGDPTARRALSPEQASTDIRQLQRRMRAMVAMCDWIDRFICRYPPPRRPTRAEAAAKDQGCASCARLAANWSPAYAEPQSDGVPSRPLCRWCYGVVLAVGRWPPLAALERHRDGARVTRQMLEP